MHQLLGRIVIIGAPRQLVRPQKLCPGHYQAHSKGEGPEYINVVHIRGDAHLVQFLAEAGLNGVQPQYQLCDFVVRVVQTLLYDFGTSVGQVFIVVSQRLVDTIETEASYPEDLLEDSIILLNNQSSLLLTPILQLLLQSLHKKELQTKHYLRERRILLTILRNAPLEPKLSALAQKPLLDGLIDIELGATHARRVGQPLPVVVGGAHQEHILLREGSVLDLLFGSHVDYVDLGIQ